MIVQPLKKHNTLFTWRYTGYKTFVPKCIQSFDREIEKEGNIFET
jgi:hypothetical protein